MTKFFGSQVSYFDSQKDWLQPFCFRLYLAYHLHVDCCSFSKGPLRSTIDLLPETWGLIQGMKLIKQLPFVELVRKRADPSVMWLRAAWTQDILSLAFDYTLCLISMWALSASVEACQAFCTVSQWSLSRSTALAALSWRCLKQRLGLQRQETRDRFFNKSSGITKAGRKS